MKLLFSIFFLFALPAFGAGLESLSRETLRYIVDLPNDVASPSELTVYRSYPNHKAFAVELIEGRVSYEFAQRVGRMSSQREANEVALVTCETKNGNDCVLYYEGDANVLKTNLIAYNSGELKGFLSSQIEICKKYGFDQSAVGPCVQQTVNRILDIPLLSRDQYQMEQRSRLAQMQRQRPSYNWNAITNLGQCIANGTCWPTNNSQINRPAPVPNQRPSCKYQCRLGEIIYTNDMICQPQIYRNGERCWQQY